VGRRGLCDQLPYSETCLHRPGFALSSIPTLIPFSEARVSRLSRASESPEFLCPHDPEPGLADFVIITGTGEREVYQERASPLTFPTSIYAETIRNVSKTYQGELRVVCMTVSL
jgi:hypothetical protein